MNIPKESCCGCGACANVCPVRCIAMREDDEGFLYPVTDAAKCVHCGLCEQVCVPADKSRAADGAAPQAFGCYALDTRTRRESSSGGIFFELARRTLQRGGCAFGVAMDDDCKGASFRKAETETELRELMTSKYLQAVAGEAYREAARELKAGREVFFSGTPCHINALRLYLRRANVNAEKLFCADVICHGAPSPKLWRAYAREFERKRNAVLKAVSFRCKERSWREFGMSLESHSAQRLFIPARQDPYMRLFLSNYSLRPSCYACASKTLRLSDLTLGDFWGIEKTLPALNDGNGTSLVLLRTEKGRRMFEEIRDGLRCEETDYRDATRNNAAEYQSVARPAGRGEFFADAETLTLEGLCVKYLPFSRRVKNALMKLWNKIPIGGGRMNRKFRYGLLMEFDPLE